MDKRLQSPKVEHYDRFEQDLEVLRIEESVTASAFLDLLDCDMTGNPEILQLLPEDLFRRGENLTTGMKTDLDEELPDDFVFA
ncbi:type II toxin-antitoxin system PrlF family antitoxin [Scytonema sp. NUACC26]|uniref:type II toxin-antitoxin system PrlF family antitoxin n=1 Tax=Scytonema sp. NUACC26 TaxID=3140176 RepID=UPI0034DB85DC